MAKYVVLAKWTSEGMKHIKDSPQRLDKARELAKSQGVVIESFYMVMGDHDMVLVLDAPDDAAMARFALKVGAGGHVGTTTMKAFSEAEYRAIVGAL